jgi:hypothetical protein
MDFIVQLRHFMFAMTKESGRYIFTFFNLTRQLALIRKWHN